MLQTKREDTEYIWKNTLYLVLPPQTDGLKHKTQCQQRFRPKQN